MLGGSLLGAAGLHVSDMLAFLMAVGVVHDQVFPASSSSVDRGLSLPSMLWMVQHLFLSIADPSYTQPEQHQGQQQLEEQWEQQLVWAHGHPGYDAFKAKVLFYRSLLWQELPADLASE